VLLTVEVAVDGRLQLHARTEAHAHAFATMHVIPQAAPASSEE
jgi:hypothetical protein